MLTTTAIALILSNAPPISPPSVAPPEPGEQMCFSAPPAPSRLDVTPFASTSADGSQVWGADATYALSSGDTGEAFYVIDADGGGEATLMINGDIVAHAAIAEDPVSRNFVITTWVPPNVNYPPETVAELMRVDLPSVVLDELPQEFKCSAWGKKVLRAGKYLWNGVVAATNIACCASSLGAGCAVCVGTTVIVDTYISDRLDNHCD